MLQRTQLAPKDLCQCVCVCVCVCVKERERERERERETEGMYVAEVWLHVRESLCVYLCVYTCQFEQIHSPVTSSFCLSVSRHWECSSQKPRQDIHTHTHTHTQSYQPWAGVEITDFWRGFHLWQFECVPCIFTLSNECSPCLSQPCTWYAHVRERKVEERGEEGGKACRESDTKKKVWEGGRNELRICLLPQSCAVSVSDSSVFLGCHRPGLCWSDSDYESCRTQTAMYTTGDASLMWWRCILPSSGHICTHTHMHTVHAVDWVVW